MCSQKLYCFLGWTHLISYDPVRTTNVAAVMSIRPEPVSYPWSAVMEGRTHDAKKNDRWDIRGAPLVSGVDPLPRRVPISGSNCRFGSNMHSALRHLEMYHPDVLRRCLGSGTLHSGPRFPRIQCVLRVGAARAVWVSSQLKACLLLTIPSLSSLRQWGRAPPRRPKLSQRIGSSRLYDRAAAVFVPKTASPQARIQYRGKRQSFNYYYLLLAVD
jgi:hypothetical protein